jgi:hypothetical protein
VLPASSKPSADLFLRSAAFCCLLGANPFWPDFCSSFRIHKKLSVVSGQSSVVGLEPLPSRARHRQPWHGETD